ncbi:hypothetical protein HNQ59_001792 [Chitinivorax tropicus]|uniref:Uncharacterized protein n=1 Tax=Chitinivorax tropicus TaxID=714531 RepID=A0A840MQP6_9PROT|nr:DUF6404 family protein [Chitinivorax tropicus]MBB5018503.1 hypothetical protein [Chitinivorax tropicus]
MKFELKRNQALEIMAKTGVWRNHYEPPAFRALWKMGAKIPPPHFTPFIPLAICMGLTFGVMWGIFMWLFMWSHTGIELEHALWASGLAGLLFGFLMALYYTYGKYKYKLPNWSSLGTEVSRS